jgi:PIN domain nuclease of toxin-antitoxin system
MGRVGDEGQSLGYLLDTHVFLWAIRNPKRLSKRAREIIEDTSNKLYLSAISAYEVMYKQSLGKLDSSYDVAARYYVSHVKILGASDLPVDMVHAHEAGSLEWEHRDPFDRILVVQSILECLTLITDDATIRAYQRCNSIW